MPIPQETVAETAPATDLPKIKEKALPTNTEDKPAEKTGVEEKQTESGNGTEKTEKAEKEGEKKEESAEKEGKKVENKKEEEKEKIEAAKGEKEATKEEKESTKVVEEKETPAEKEAAEAKKDTETSAAGETKAPEETSAVDAAAPSTPSKTDAAMAENPDLTPKKAEAFNLLAQGKRHYLVKDYESAVETLGEVSTRLVIDMQSLNFNCLLFSSVRPIFKHFTESSSSFTVCVNPLPGIGCIFLKRGRIEPLDLIISFGFHAISKRPLSLMVGF